MKVVQAEVLGMCFGVRDALQIIAGVEEPSAVTIHGELVHNERVLTRLHARGFQMIQESRRRPLPQTETVLVTAHGIRAALADWLALDLDGRYTSRMMLTNTNDPRFVVPASWYADGALTFTLRGQSLLVAVRNLFDDRVYTGGYPGALAGSSDPEAMEPYYYMLAPRNVTVTARIGF